ncbi:hypothetical protein K474DRAFT_641154 [Panus rudis PR-1116 ss-1]|nr:hypothetical protein K474DRAFT_641154 [Panus rudis PR-1116 ss-1]
MASSRRRSRNKGPHVPTSKIALRIRLLRIKCYNVIRKRTRYFFETETRGGTGKSLSGWSSGRVVEWSSGSILTLTLCLTLDLYLLPSRVDMGRTFIRNLLILLILPCPGSPRLSSFCGLTCECESVLLLLLIMLSVVYCQRIPE